jgi:hypothetical protein
MSGLRRKSNHLPALLPKSAGAPSDVDVRFWHKADMPIAPAKKESSSSSLSGLITANLKRLLDVNRPASRV